MARNLTVSLSKEDWAAVQGMARLLGETYSRVFHRLIEAARGVRSDDRRIAKYRSLLRPHAGFLAARAASFAKVRGGVRRAL